MKRKEDLSWAHGEKLEALSGMVEKGTRLCAENLKRRKRMVLGMIKRMKNMG